MDHEKTFEVKKESGEVFLRIFNVDVNPHIILESLRTNGAVVSLEQLEEVISTNSGDWVSMTEKEKREVEIRISADRMKADILLDLSENNTPPGMDKIRKILEEKGVIFGIQEGIIDHILHKGISISGKWIEIARGKPARDGVDATFQVFVDTDRKGPIHSDEAAQVDLKNLGIINNVQDKQVIVTKTPMEKEEDGRDVTGRIVKARKAKDVTIKAGPNTRLSENGLEIIASAGGHLLKDGNRFSVEKVFHVKGDVDYSTGNLECSGSINVAGSVTDDFSIRASEELDITGVVEGAHLYSGKNMTLRSSVRGMGKGVINCGKHLHAEYMDQCDIKTGGNLFFKRALMHCEVETEGAIRTLEGGKGLIAGGTLKAGTEIECTVLGTKMGTKTYIHVGVSPRLMDHKKELQTKMEKLLEKEKTLEKNILYLSKTLNERGLSPEQKVLAAKYLELRPVLQEQLEKIEALQREVNEAIDKAKLKGSVIVRGCCFPGVSISIRKKTFLVKEPLEEVRFAYRDGRVRPLALEE